jgi:hypothetical protein
MVVPGLPHHCDPARKSARGNLLRGWRSADLLRHACGAVTQVQCGGVGLLPYAQSCPFDFDAAGSRQHEPGLGRSASPVYQLHQCAWPMERSSISEPVRAGRHGRVALEVRGIVRQSESVRARLVSRVEDRAWSSARAHLAGEDDSLVSMRRMLDRWPIFRDLLLEDYEG